ncbi:MAG: hypothetical protein VKO39_07955 [Cyanobacteriota bacterium]|nr:hypothetical protein [Cyanobacteriota bacterium]
MRSQFSQRQGSALSWCSCLLGLLTWTLPAAAGEDPTWSATVELYGFAPLRTTGTTTIRGFEAEVDTSLGELIPLIETVGSVRGSVEKGRLGLLTDVSYVQIGDEVTRTGRRGLLTGRVEQTSIQGLYDIAFRYRFGAPESAIGTPGQLSVIPYAGVRLVKQQLDLAAVIEGEGPLDLRLRKQGTWKRLWTQPLLGTQTSLFLTPGLRAFARADIGGLGLAGDQDLSGNAQVGLGLALGANTQLDLSWRYFGLAYSNGAERETGINIDQNGVELGLKVFF